MVQNHRPDEMTKSGHVATYLKIQIYDAYHGAYHDQITNVTKNDPGPAHQTKHVTKLYEYLDLTRNEKRAFDDVGFRIIHRTNYANMHVIYVHQMQFVFRPKHQSNMHHHHLLVRLFLNFSKWLNQSITGDLICMYMVHEMLLSHHVVY